MFDGIKMLCMGVDENSPFFDCLHSVIVTEAKFLKLANKQYRCPFCGHTSDMIQPFFHALIKLRKAAMDFNNSGTYIRSYGLVFEGCHEDGFHELTPYILENNDWGNWNMQIASCGIALTEEPAYRIELWEDHNFKARPFVYPQQSATTFSSILRKKSMYLGSQEINVDLLKVLIKEVRNYNKAWLKLLDSHVTAAPVDLKNALYTHLAEVDSLDELFSDDERYT
jgi:hypothetical protein